MLGRKTKSRPPLAYEAIPLSARLDAAYKNSFNFSRDVTDLYAHTSISGLRKRSRTQPADQQGMLMGDINVVNNRTPNFQEKVGGPRAAVAFTGRAQIASAVYDNQTGVASAATTVGILTQSGTSATILVASSTWKIGDLTVVYSSGSVTASSNNAKFYVYADDPFYKGGAVIYKASLNAFDTRAALGRVDLGSIVLAPGGGGSGGGGGGGGCVLEGTEIEALDDEPMLLERLENEKWYTITTEHFSLTASYDHPVCDTHHGFIPIANISIGDYVVTKKGEEKVVNCYTSMAQGVKVKVTMAHGHLFWGNGVLCHNIK